MAFDEGFHSGDESGNLILGHHGTCESGARTIGACAHVTAICWYLGFARHQTNQRYPSSRLLSSVLSAISCNKSLDFFKGPKKLDGKAKELAFKTLIVSQQLPIYRS